MGWGAGFKEASHSSTDPLRLLCTPTGGYQLVGRTLPIWNTWGRTGPFSPDKPWLLEFFDQVGNQAPPQGVHCVLAYTAQERTGQAGDGVGVVAQLATKPRLSGSCAICCAPQVRFFQVSEEELITLRARFERGQYMPQVGLALRSGWCEGAGYIWCHAMLPTCHSDRIAILVMLTVPAPGRA